MLAGSAGIVSGFRQVDVEFLQNYCALKRARVWRAIWRSSSVLITRTRTTDCAVEIVGAFFSFASASRWTPMKCSALQIFARTIALFSPMPPVKTSMSRPSSAAA